MSRIGPRSITIGARITAGALATAISRDIAEVSVVLESKDESGSPEAMMPAQLAIEVAKVLGVEVGVEARDLALEALYGFEAVGDLPPGEGRADRLARGIVDEIEDLDRAIEGASEHWAVARMPVVDRNVLRIGLYELLHETQLPKPVIISEAVRLAQTYSTERSASFVNGVLSNLAEELRPSAR